MRLAYPFGELHCIRNGGRKKHVANGVREENDGLFPDHPTLFITHVVNFVEYDPCDFTHDFGTTV